MRSLPEHPTNAIWARFRNVKDWDGYDLLRRFPDYARSCQVSRASATNHLTGYGWWCWIIPLRGGDFSAGLVYDSRLYTSRRNGASLGERLKAHLLTHPVGREIFRDAEYIEGDVKAYSMLPYYAERLAGPGWQIVGDAASFLDPLYSQGLDYCSWTVSAAVDRILRESHGEACDLDELNARFSRSYRGWFEALYKDKYYYLGDKELMTAAFLMDLGLFFYGPVRSVVHCPRAGFAEFPFEGSLDGAIVRALHGLLQPAPREDRAEAACGRRLRFDEPGFPDLIERLRTQQACLETDPAGCAHLVACRMAQPCVAGGPIYSHGISGWSRLRWPFHLFEISLKRSNGRAN